MRAFAMSSLFESTVTPTLSIFAIVELHQRQHDADAWIIRSSTTPTPCRALVRREPLRRDVARSSISFLEESSPVEVLDVADLHQQFFACAAASTRSASSSDAHSGFSINKWQPCASNGSDGLVLVRRTTRCRIAIRAQLLERREPPAIVFRADLRRARVAVENPASSAPAMRRRCAHGVPERADPATPQRIFGLAIREYSSWREKLAIRFFSR